MASLSYSKEARALELYWPIAGDVARGVGKNACWLEQEIRVVGISMV